MTTTMNQMFRESLNRLTDNDLARHAAAMGVDYDGRGLDVSFYDHVYRVNPGKIEDDCGQPPADAIGRVLCRYLLRPPQKPSGGRRRVTFRELNGAGPLVSSFTGNTNKIIAGTFGTRAIVLESIAKRMGARPEPDGGNFDLFLRFEALPEIPVFLQFNAADDLFPAQAALLFLKSAENHLDMQSIFILATYLTGRLINGGKTQDR